MTNDKIIASVSYCGLICALCFQGSKCKGCKSANNQCPEDLSDAGCYQKGCCQKRGYAGCWECDRLRDCVEGIYALGDMSKIKAFAICMREDGIPYFIERVLANMERGLSVEKGKDYDGKPVSEVLRMLRTEGAR